MDIVLQVAALASSKRLLILEWLKAPGQHFGPEHPFDKAEGVCGLYIAEKLGVSPATASVHLKVLTQAGFIRPLRIGKYTYFKGYYILDESGEAAHKGLKEIARHDRRPAKPRFH